MADRRSLVGLVGVLAVVLGVCCGIPILFSVGLAGAIAGLSSGNSALVAAAVGVIAIGFWRLIRRGPHCEVTTSTVTSIGTEQDDVPQTPVVRNSNGAHR